MRQYHKLTDVSAPNSEGGNGFICRGGKSQSVGKEVPADEKAEAAPSLLERASIGPSVPSSASRIYCLQFTLDAGIRWCYQDLGDSRVPLLIILGPFGYFLAPEGVASSGHDTPRGLRRHSCRRKESAIANLFDRAASGAACNASS